MYEYKARVLKVIDGDTIDVIVDLGFNVYIKERMRLYGIDTPETRTRDKAEKRKGLMAKQYVKSALLDQTVRVKTEEKGKFGRYLATIWYSDGNRCINDELIENKMAKIYHGGKRA